MFESHYKKVYAGNFIMAQLIFNKLQDIDINAVLKDDNQTGISAMLAEDYEGLIEVFVHEDEFTKASVVVEQILGDITK